MPWPDVHVTGETNVTNWMNFLNLQNLVTVCNQLQITWKYLEKPGRKAYQVLDVLVLFGHTLHICWALPVCKTNGIHGASAKDHTCSQKTITHCHLTK